MKVTLLLADSAQAVGGKLYILGGGWSNISPGWPFSVVAKIEVPWSQGTDEHTWRLELVDADGQLFTLPYEGDGEPPTLTFEERFSTGIPPGIVAGTPLDHVLVVNIGPGLPLAPGERYQWHLTIDGRAHEDWVLGFSTRPAAPRELAA